MRELFPLVGRSDKSVKNQMLTFLIISAVIRERCGGSGPQTKDQACLSDMTRIPAEDYIYKIACSLGGIHRTPPLLGAELSLHAPPSSPDSPQESSILLPW